MARDGSGTYALPATMAVASAVSSSVTVNTIMNDIAQALTDSINKDGSKAFAAAQSMGGNRLTSLGAATALTDAAQYGQLQKANVSRAVTVAGTVDAITLAFNPTITSLTTGMKIRWVSGGANTIAGATVNVDTLGAIVVKANPGAAALVVGQLGAAGTENEATYNGTNWVLTTGYATLGANAFGGSQTISGASVTLSLTSDTDFFPQINATNASATAGSGPYNLLYRARGTNAAPTVVQSGDIMGTFGWGAYDGGAYRAVATVSGYVDAAPGASDMPSRIVFSTTPDGSITLAERFRISSNGGFGLAGANFGTSGQFLKSNGDAAPTWAAAGMTLLGTITTTSGASQPLNGLTLTGYKFLRCVVNGVSGSSTGIIQIGSLPINQAAANGDANYGILDIELSTGVASCMVVRTNGGATTPTAGTTGITNASTSVVVSVASGTLDAGSVTVYGY